MSLPYQFREIEMEESENNFYLVLFNGVDVIVNPEQDKFNATRLLRDIILNKNIRYSQWREGKPAKILIESRDMEIQVCGCRAVNGRYLDWSLFYSFVYGISPVYGARWLNGVEDWNRPEKEGYLYLVQPQDKIETDIYKIGRTYDYKKRFKSYGKNAVILRVVRVDDMTEAENILLKIFEEKFERAVRDGNGVGEEYFHVKSKNLAITAFKEAIEKYQE